ncbi:phage portal protein family protein [Sandaracinus amylolyticus]|uniref:Mu-like prophage FluMu protein gp29 n=1 Tax=Sandaracinus amylolyticus TaxID=927083 RepID=A0A0F6W700_9BACT|nr:DUF935 family protein [Sandaracinus amylolyticus]AKF08877.1 Mu-like prophage FluMu protein gp29 [Sandaracinus amylolyticus]
MATTDAATPAAAPESRPAQGTRIVGPELRSRWTTPRFGAITPERLASILKSADDGRTEDWANFCEYLVEDADLFGIYHTRRNAVAGAPWDLEPGYSPDPIAQRYAARAAEFCRRAMLEMADLERTWLDALDAIGVGWSAAELIWKRDHGAWVVSDAEWVRAARLRFDETWKLRLYDMGEHGSEGLELPPGKFLVHVPRSRASYPVRSGEFRTIAWYWLFHRWVIKYWLATGERHGGPFLYMRVPASTRGDVKREGKAILERMRNDGVAVVDEGTFIEMLESAMTGADVFDTLCARFERGYAKALLGATLTVDVGDSGSRALGTEHGKVRLERSQGDARFLAGSWRRDVLYWLCFHNRHLFDGVMPPVPTLKLQPEGDTATVSDKLIDIGGATYDEARERDGLPAWGPGKGGDKRIPAVSGSASALPALPTPGAPSGVPEGGEKVADAALNGAQIDALKGIVADVASGLIPRETGIELIVVAFPTIPREKALEILGPVEEGSVTPDGEPVQQAPAGGAAPPPFGASGSTPRGSGTPSLASRARASRALSSRTTSAPRSPTTPTSSRSQMSPLARALLGGSDGPKS